MRSPIRRVGAQRVARGVPSVPRHTIEPLAAAPHGADALSVVASLLRSAHRSDPALPRILSCRATLRAVLSACASAPAAPALCFALCRSLCVCTAAKGAGDAPHALRCAAAVAPSASVGERLALRSVAAGGTAAAAAAALAQRCERHSSFSSSSSSSFSAFSAYSSYYSSSSYAEWAAAFLRVWRLSPLRSSSSSRSEDSDSNSLLLLMPMPLPLPLGADAVRCAEFEIAQCAAAGLRDETAALVAAQSFASLSAMRDATLARAYALIGGTGDALPLREALIAASCASLSVSVHSVVSPFARGRSLPAVARDGALLAAVLRGVVRDARHTTKTKTKSPITVITPQQKSALRDIESLCAMANAYGIAASFVPHDSSSSSDDNKEDKENKDSKEDKENKDSKGAVLAAAMAKKWDATRARRLAAVVAAIGDAAEFAADAGDAAALQRAIGVLSELFALCSEKPPKNEKNKTSEGRRVPPAWRERLRGAEARTHKYELLCAEVPHAALAQCLATVLSHGFVAAAGELGARLAAGGFVDLRHYPLSLLGALFHAARAAQQPPDAAEAIAALYVRRRRVFGEDEPNSSSSSGSRETAVVLRGEGPRVEALRARSTAAAGAAFVVDESFGVWLRKATASAAVC